MAALSMLCGRMGAAEWAAGRRGCLALRGILAQTILLRRGTPGAVIANITMVHPRARRLPFVGSPSSPQTSSPLSSVQIILQERPDFPVTTTSGRDTSLDIVSSSMSCPHSVSGLRRRFNPKQSLSNFQAFDSMMQSRPSWHTMFLIRQSWRGRENAAELVRRRR